MEEFIGKTADFYDDLIYRGQHILVAGQSGSGKSVLLNGLINSILYKNPADVGLILIDPKRVELSWFEDVPHCIGYADTIPEIEALLDKVGKMVDRRFDKMKANHERFYSGPAVYVIIDEMADLMFRSKATAKFLEHIMYTCRAANVKVIAATQIPLASVIPTKIRSNFGITVGLRTVNRQQSRNILDENGCESLPIHGMALVRYPGEDGLKREKVPMIPEDQIQKIIDFRTGHLHG